MLGVESFKHKEESELCSMWLKAKEEKTEKGTTQSLISGWRRKEVCGKEQIKDAQQSEGVLYKDSGAGIGKIQT